MKRPLLNRHGLWRDYRQDEAGVTIVLVALVMVAVMAMAALSIDVVTLYLANAEAQKSADAAALSGARILSLTGMTGDPNNSANRWQQACNFASQVAIAVAEQNTVGGGALSNAQVTVTFPNNSDQASCTGTTPAFGVNPLISVKVQRTDVPTFFARIWSKNNASVSATATAEAFNASNSDSVGNGGTSGLVTPVQPRCVKPWIVPNRDPKTGSRFVQDADGSIQTPGIRINYGGTGIVGEKFDLVPDCQGASCSPPKPDNPPRSPDPNTLQYVPGQPPASASAVPGCTSTGTAYEAAIAGCDQTTVYQCGVKSAAAVTPNRLDLTINPAADTSSGVQCLINQATGQDTLDTSAYPFHIQLGAGNPLVVSGGLASGAITTTSPSIVTLPIYDSGPALVGTSPAVTIVGFLQVFINNDNGAGSENVTVLNVVGCGDGTNAVNTAVSGTSPVPVRLITYP